MWFTSLVDINSTLRDVCGKVTEDVDVEGVNASSSEQRQRRLDSLTFLGNQCLHYAVPEEKGLKYLRSKLK